MWFGIHNDGCNLFLFKYENNSDAIVCVTHSCDSYRDGVKPQYHMTGNAPPCEVCLMPLKAWQRVSFPPSPQHVLITNDIRKRASRRRHEFKCFIVWKRSWYYWNSRLQDVWDLMWHHLWNLICMICCVYRFMVRRCYRAPQFPGPRRISAWHEWLSPAPLWSAFYLCEGPEEEGSHTCSTNPAQKTRNQRKWQSVFSHEAQDDVAWKQHGYLCLRWIIS